MRRHLQEELLREYIRSSLLTEDDGGYDGVSMGMIGPYGVRFGSNEDMYNAFVGPFVDVFKTAVGKTKEISRKAQTVVWVGLQTVLTTLIPVYGYNYAEVFDKEKEDIEKIRSEYQDVYDRTDESLKNNDAALLAFMACPAATLGAFGSKMAPKAAKEMFSAASGGLSDEIYDGLKNKLEKAGRWALGDDGGPRSSSGGSKSKGKKGPSGFDFSSMGESQINEEEEGSDKKGDVTPKKLLKSKLFLKKVLEAPKVQHMQKEASEIYRNSLNEVYTQAESILKKAKTVEDIEKIAGKKMKPDMKAKIAEIKKLPPQEKAKAEQMLIDGSKKAMKEFYVKNLTDQVKVVTDAGIPEESQYVKDYRSTIQKIKAL
jgi:uncharacterized protein YqgQ